MDSPAQLDIDTRSAVGHLLGPQPPLKGDAPDLSTPIEGKREWPPEPTGTKHEGHSRCPPRTRLERHPRVVHCFFSLGRSTATRASRPSPVPLPRSAQGTPPLIRSPSQLQPNYGAWNLNYCGRYHSWRLYRRRLSSTHARHRSHSYSWRYRRFSRSRLVHSIPFRVYAYPSPTSRSSTAASASTDCRYFWVCYSSLRGRRNSYFHSSVGHSRINSRWYCRLSSCLSGYRHHPCGRNNHHHFYAPRSGALRSLT